MQKFEAVFDRKLLERSEAIMRSVWRYATHGALLVQRPEKFQDSNAFYPKLHSRSCRLRYSLILSSFKLGKKWFCSPAWRIFSRFTWDDARNAVGWVRAALHAFIFNAGTHYFWNHPIYDDFSFCFCGHMSDLTLHVSIIRGGSVLIGRCHLLATKLCKTRL